MAQVAADIMAADRHELTAAMSAALAALGAAFGADRAFSVAFDASGRGLERNVTWARPGLPPVAVDVVDMPGPVQRWWRDRVLQGVPMRIRSVRDLGTEGDADADAARELMEAEGVTGLLIVPVVMDGRPRGVMAFGVVDRSYPFDDDVESLVQVTGQLMVGAIERTRSEEALLDITAELGVRNHELERSNRDLEDFAYVASHDLKSPLLVVRGFLDLLERGQGGALSDDAQTFVAAAIRGAARMEQLIDDLLAYSRAGRSSLEATDVDLGEVVAGVLDDLSAVLGPAGATVDVGPLPVVRADRTQLAQVVQNLVGNAVKFARDGVAPHVTIGAERDGDRWTITVADNGVGVPADEREAVFGMFSRLDATADRSGSGIGLAIAQRVVEAHGGAIWLEASEAGGTAVRFTLPA